MKMLIAILTGILIAGCVVQQQRSEDQSGPPALRPVVYPSGGAIKYPEDQVIKKELQVTTQ